VLKNEGEGMDYKEEVGRLTERLSQLQKELQEIPLYEYHIDSLKLDKVNGTFHIGQLVKDDTLEKEGVHKIYVEELKIHEVGDNGTVGLGVIKKNDKKKNQDKIPPSKASKEVKKIYEEVKQFLDVNHVPIFFQKLAVKKEVLKKIWGLIKKEEGLKNKVFSFYKEANQELAEIEIKILFHNQVETSYCENLKETIETEIKTLPTILLLLQLFLPGYIDRTRLYIDQKFSSVKDIDTGKKEDFLDAIRKRYNIKELPRAVKELEADVIAIVYNNTIKPLAKADKDQSLYMDFVQLMIQEVSNTNLKPNQLSPMSIKEESFLYALLIEQVKSLPKHILIEFAFFKTICKQPGVNGDEDLLEKSDIGW
jgi:hypothetical protein